MGGKYAQYFPPMGGKYWAVISVEHIPFVQVCVGNTTNYSCKQTAQAGDIEPAGVTNSVPLVECSVAGCFSKESQHLRFRSGTICGWLS